MAGKRKSTKKSGGSKAKREQSPDPVQASVERGKRDPAAVGVTLLVPKRDRLAAAATTTGGGTTRRGSIVAGRVRGARGRGTTSS